MSAKAPQESTTHAPKGKGGAHGGSHEEEHEGAPEWLISFADNVTLMMGFFVILLALNLKPSGGEGTEGGKEGEGQPASPSPDLIDFSIAVRQGFNNPVDLESTDPIDLPLIRRIRERQGESEANQPGPEGYEHDVKSIRPTDYYGRGGTVPFEDDSSMLTPAALETVEKIGEQLRGHRLIIAVRGHASLAEAVRHEPRGMDLAYARALAVARVLVEHGLQWEQIRLVACGDSDPLVEDAYSATQHRQNQRVEVMTTDRVVTD